MSIDDYFERIATALERIADSLDKQAVTSYGDQAEPTSENTGVRRRPIADRVEHWKATHPTWASDPIPSQVDITAATGVVSGDSISKIRRALLEHQEAVRRCTESD